MGITKSSLFLRWIYSKKSQYPEFLKYLEFQKLKTTDRNIIFFKEDIKKTGNEKLIKECNDAWSKFRIIPKILVRPNSLRHFGRLC
ncbi:MAG: hypothetical protein IIB02_01515 [Thaumarchaeota archaeon]|nr:hypothetical protein [Nitrososphaerota archaeon]